LLYDENVTSHAQIITERYVARNGDVDDVIFHDSEFIDCAPQISPI